MRKIKRKRGVVKKSSQSGSAILFTIVIAALIGLVGIVHIAIANFISIYNEDEKVFLDEIAIFKEERELLKEENSNLYSRENIFKLLNENEKYSKDSLYIGTPIDTIMVRFWFDNSAL